MIKLAMLAVVVACGGSSPAQTDAALDASEIDAEPDACVGPAAPASTDCTSGACQTIAISGEVVPAQGFRGFADPSIRVEPAGTRLWTGYSFVRPVQTVDGSGQTIVMGQVEGHAGHSEDGGATWSLDAKIYPNVGPMLDPGGSGKTGVFNNETIGLAPVSATSWFASRLSYFVEAKTTYSPLISSFTVRIAHASSPDQLANAPEQVIALTSFLPASYGAAYSLNALSGLTCSYWNDPGLFYANGTLYLTAECVGGATIHLFSAPATEDVSQLVWTDRGALTTPADAAELGDDELDQADLEAGSDGRIRLIVTPTHLSSTLSTHEGCRMLVVDSLDAPALHRVCGKLEVDASVTASDASSTGSCGYDPHSTMGVVLARRPDSTHPGELVRSTVP